MRLPKVNIYIYIWNFWFVLKNGCPLFVYFIATKQSILVKICCVSNDRKWIKKESWKNSFPRQKFATIQGEQNLFEPVIVRVCILSK